MKDKRINFRVSETMDALIRKKAADAGMNITDYSRRQAEGAYEPNVLDISDTFGGTHSIGADTAYLVGNIFNIVDEDEPVEDCTTKHYPTERKKNHGPVMSGM